MHLSPAKLTRRSFVLSTAAASALPSLALQTPAVQPGSQPTAPTPSISPSVLGPRPGYTPQIGTLVSQLTWMRHAPVTATRGLTQTDLDHLFDAQANSIGALLLHLAAIESAYQLNTFQGVKWDTWSADFNNRWKASAELGDAGRKTIKGHDLAFYLDNLKETRAKSLAEFAKRDDAWLMAVDQTWPWGPTNNYCKWFHVCEHESHHAGQIAFLKKRLPGAKPEAEG